MTQHRVIPQGQVLAGAQYPGQHAGMYGLQQHPGQHLLIGSETDPEPVVTYRDDRKCTKTREIDGVSQHCNAWAVKERGPKLCTAHHRERDKELADGSDSTADEGSHQASS